MDNLSNHEIFYLLTGRCHNNEEEDEGCHHTMSDCNCYENEDEDENHTQCWNCGEDNPEAPYRLPKIHGGWIGYMCCWECVEEINNNGGGNSMARQFLINRYKQTNEYWKCRNR